MTIVNKWWKFRKREEAAPGMGGCKFMNIVLGKTSLTFEQRPLNNKDGVTL